MTRGRPPKNLGDNFPNNIRKMRNRAGLTQEQLGTRANIGHTAISKLELGENELRMSTAIVLARALDCRPMDLFLEGVRLDEKQVAWLALIEALPADQQDTLFKLGRALAEPPNKNMAVKTGT